MTTYLYANKSKADSNQRNAEQVPQRQRSKQTNKPLQNSLTGNKKPHYTTKQYDLVIYK